MIWAEVIFWRVGGGEGRPLSGAGGLAGEVADFEGEELDPALDDLLGGVGTGGEVGVAHSDGEGNAGVLGLKVGEVGEGGEEGGGHGGLGWVGFGLGKCYQLAERISERRPLMAGVVRSLR